MPREMGRYQLVRPLARGGMAEVFLARRRAGGLEKLLVVKRIRPERANDARFLELFLREARLSMGLTHQNIVPVFDFGRTGDQVFLAMERVEGKDLGSTLARAGDQRLPPMVAAFVAGECCRALAYAHDRRGPGGEPLGIVHRDVTPRNVLVSWSGEVKLTDFGIASLAGDDHRALLGTPAYLAPEQARGEPVDGRADVYAVGLVLRELLTGTRARAGDDRETLLAAARAGALVPWPADVDPALAAIVDRATALDRAQRYPDARAMLAELDHDIVDRRAAVRADAPATQLARWMAAVWDGATDDGDAELGADAGSELYSFLDDGEPGSNTARSLAATAAEGEVAAPPSVAPAAPVAAPVPAPPPAASSRRAIALVALAVAGLGAAALVIRGRRATSTTPTIDAGTPDAARAVDAGPVDAPPPDAPPPDAPPPDAPPTRGADGGRSVPLHPPRLDAGTAIDAPAAPATRTVRINARPWAIVYVDGAAAGLETIATVQLSPGRHRLRFVNPQLGVEREITIDVPADRDLDHVEDLRR
ncbi:MAG: serine/threonine protein kinase [Myxococcales bacterium]|nr:serine/threonine protein kinase [Myxococcales bacterium]